MNMAEIPDNPEHREARALATVAGYENIPPSIDMWRMPSELLDQWIADCEGVSLPPEAARGHAWMHIERAAVATVTGVRGDGNVTFDEVASFAADHTAKAERILVAAMNSTHDP